MIALITGKLAHKSATSIIVDAGGVGYELHIPLSSFYELPDQGGVVTLHVHTHLREDSLMLFGFLTRREKELFLALTAVSGIGPKLALTVISGLPPEVFLDALLRGDDKKLSTIPGIGPKTAARLVLELKDKAKTLGAVVMEATSMAAISSGNNSEAISALVNLGYKKNLAEDAVRRATKDGPSSLEDIIKTALKAMSKG